MTKSLIAVKQAFKQAGVEIEFTPQVGLDLDSFLKVTNHAFVLFFNKPERLTSLQIRQVAAVGTLSTDREAAELAEAHMACVAVANPKGYVISQGVENTIGIMKKAQVD